MGGEEAEGGVDLDVDFGADVAGDFYAGFGGARGVRAEAVVV